MLIIPVYPLVLVGIIVIGLFSFAIWLMCYENVVNRKIIADSNRAASRRPQNLTTGRRQQNTVRSPSSNVVRASRTSRNFGSTSDTQRTEVRVHHEGNTTPSYSQSGRGVQHIADSSGNLQNNTPLGYDNLSRVVDRDEQRPMVGEVISLPSYQEAMISRTDPDYDPPPKYEDLDFSST